MNKKFYWTISSLFLIFIVFFSFLMIKQWKEIEQIKTEKRIADQLLNQIMDQRLAEKEQKTVPRNVQDTAENIPILDTPNTHDPHTCTDDNCIHEHDDLPIESVTFSVDPTKERPLGLDAIDYDSVPGIPTLEDLTTTYKLKMAVDPDGAESLMPHHPIRSDYTTYEEYKRADVAWFKFMRHQAQSVLNSRNQK